VQDLAEKVGKEKAAKEKAAKEKAAKEKAAKEKAAKERGTAPIIIFRVVALTHDALGDFEVTPFKMP